MSHRQTKSNAQTAFAELASNVNPNLKQSQYFSDNNDVKYEV